MRRKKIAESAPMYGYVSHTGDSLPGLSSRPFEVLFNMPRKKFDSLKWFLVFTGHLIVQKPNGGNALIFLRSFAGWPQDQRPKTVITPVLL